MELNEVLQNLGLSEKEAKVYLCLLEYREALPSVVSRKAGVKRPTTYVILEQLQKRGLTSHVKKGNLLYFRALNPKFFYEDQEKKFVDLKRVLPELISLNEKFTATPQMTVFEGKEGLIKIMEDTLTAKTELLCWADASLATGTLLADYYPIYVKKKVARKIWLRGIFSDDKRALEFKKKGVEELREVYLIPKEKYPFKNEINIYDDKVAIISHQDKLGVIIENKNIADTQKAIFNFAFEYAKILDKQVSV